MLKWLEKGTKALADIARDRAKSRIKQRSLSCNRCNVLAVPILRTTKNYECLRCSRRFSNTVHGIDSALGNVTVDLYNRVVAEMKEELKAEDDRSQAGV